MCSDGTRYPPEQDGNPVKVTHTHTHTQHTRVQHIALSREADRPQRSLIYNSPKQQKMRPGTALQLACELLPYALVVGLYSC